MKYVNVIAVFCLFGIVDQIHGNTVRVELSSSSGREMHEPIMDLPLWMFPCKISEGSSFYFTKIDGALELRCGEPPE